MCQHLFPYLGELNSFRDPRIDGNHGFQIPFIHKTVLLNEILKVVSEIELHSLGLICKWSRVNLCLCRAQHGNHYYPCILIMFQEPKSIVCSLLM